MEIEVPKQIQVYVKSDGKVDLEAKPMDFLYTPDGKIYLQNEMYKIYLIIDEYLNSLKFRKKDVTIVH